MLRSHFLTASRRPFDPGKAHLDEIDGKATTLSGSGFVSYGKVPPTDRADLIGQMG
jgi:hypothetical protein